MEQTKVAILGSGNIGTDLVVKALRSPDLDVAGVAGIDPDSTGLAKARRLGVRTSDRGVTGLMSWADFDEISLIFDATSAKAHIANNAALEPQGKTIIDLTPAALGPYVVPPVNLRDHLHAANINMVTCGGQATIPMVAAVSRVAPVRYAEIVASIASRSAGPGTRANIDEFTVTTSRAIEVVGGAAKGKSVIILNPGEPPVLMRDTIHCIIDEADPGAVRSSIERMVADVARYVPGYRLKQDVQISGLPAADALETLVPGLAARDRQKVTVFLEIEGAADYLPAYAGNLDIMTAAAIQVAEQIAADRKVATA